MNAQYADAQFECVPSICTRRGERIVCMLVAKHPRRDQTCSLTFDRMEHSVVQGLAARVVGGRADPGSAAVGQSVPGESEQERVSKEQRKTKIDLLSLAFQQIKRTKQIYTLKLFLSSHETPAEIDPVEGTDLSKKAASSLLSSTLCLVPALT